MKYCRRCDLGFCAAHEPQHPDLEGHELVEYAGEMFCAVCSGVYRPEPPSPKDKEKETRERLGPRLKRSPTAPRQPTAQPRDPRRTGASGYSLRDGNQDY